MSVSDLSASTQNYLKAIWAGAEWSDNPITASMLAERLALRTSTVSEGIRKLQKQGFVNHTPYGAVELTSEGRKNALQMVRRHRLIETFLVETLGYGWEEVHDEAEHLEHAVSDLMVERIDKLLGFPTRDPHGDPIPDADGTLNFPQAIQLTLISTPADVVVERIADDDGDILQHFTACNISVGTTLRVTEGAPLSGTLNVFVDDQKSPLSLGKLASDALYVSHAEGQE